MIIRTNKLMKRRIQFLCLILLLLSSIAFIKAQNIDSLKLVLKTIKNDTLKLQILNILVESEGDEATWVPYNDEMARISEEKLKVEIKDKALYELYLRYYAASLINKGYLANQHGESEKALAFYNQGVLNFKKANDKHGLSNALINIGYVYDATGNLQKALEYYHQSLKDKEEINDKRGIATCLNNIGLVYKKQGLSIKTVEYYHRALKIQEEINDKNGVATSLNNIAIVYFQQGDIQKALDYNKKALKLREEIKDVPGIGMSLNNIGYIHNKQGQIDVALEYYKRSLKNYESVNNRRGMATSLSNIGLMYKRKNNFSLAFECLNKALKLQEEVNDVNEISTTLASLANTLVKEGKINEAFPYAEKSLQIADKLGYPEKIAQSTFQLYEVFQKQNKPGQALEMYLRYISMRDSLTNQETRKASLKTQFQYDYDKKEAILKEQQDKERLLAETKSNHQKVIIWCVIAGFVLVLVFSIFIFNRLQITRRQKIIIEKQKKEVEFQKHIVEEKQKEILDSITYAKRLQEAILPTETNWLELLPNSFVLYKPKDIVAGDFYWLEKIKDKVFFAAADCTGHGVPGALVSVVCSNALNRTVLEFGITNPGEILDKTRELVISTFEKSDKEVKDGMDISLCCLNTKTNVLLWAGANNPLWILSQKDGEIIEDSFAEYVPDKQPIGKYAEQKPFTTHEIQLKKGDSLYVFTDGYADQFGGPKGKKFKYKQVKETLMAIAFLKPQEQKNKLDALFENWKGNLEQIDDVCVVGIKI